MRKWCNRKSGIAMLLLVQTGTVFASTTGDNIIETILAKVQAMMTGPVATAIGVICIAGAGLFIAVSGDITSGGKKAAGIAIGVGIAIMAVKLFSWLGLTGAII